MAKKKKAKPTQDPAPAQKPRAAYRHFGLGKDPFTTSSLQARDLDCFVGRVALLGRLTSSILSLSNVGIAGEAGAGKSSLMRLLESRVPAAYNRVSVCVPLDDATYFLSEVLREIQVAAPAVPGVRWAELGRRLEKEALSKNAIFSLIKSIVSRSRKPFVVFVDDLEKVKGDRVRHLTRSERTLQLLEELKPLLELHRAAFVVSLQEEFYSKVNLVVKEGADPTVLGLFKNVVLVEKFTDPEMREILAARLRGAGSKAKPEEFLEPEALTLALSMAGGNARRFLYLLSEGMYRGYARGGARVEFQDLFEALNEHLKLDLVCKKLLYFLAKSGRAVASNPDLQAFMGLDMISIARRLEILTKNRLAEIVDYAEGTKVYGLSQFKPQAPPALLKGGAERTFLLGSENAGGGEP